MAGPRGGWSVGAKGAVAQPTNRGKLDTHGGIVLNHEQLVNASGSPLWPASPQDSIYI
jgi:hypothetical protein